MKFHPLADLFPLLEGADFDALVADIKTHGQREPITLYKGEILDGRNRYRACIEAGVKPLMGELEDGADLVAFVVSANLRRRHLTDDQRAMVAEKLATRKKGGAHIGASRAKAAEMLNVNPRSLQSVRKVRKGGAPELVKAMEQGEIAISAAAEVAKLPSEEQREIVTAGPEAVKAAAKKIRKRQEKTAVDLLRERAQKNGYALSMAVAAKGAATYSLKLKTKRLRDDGYPDLRDDPLDIIIACPDLDAVAAHLDIVEGKHAEPALPPAPGACAVDPQPEPVEPKDDAPSLYDSDPAVAARHRREAIERLGDEEAAVDGEVVEPASAEPELAAPEPAPTVVPVDLIGLSPAELSDVIRPALDAMSAPAARSFSMWVAHYAAARRAAAEALAAEAAAA